MKAGRSAWLAVLAFASATHVFAAQPHASPMLRSVQAAVEGDVTIVTITADGPLPEPASGAVDGPPRIFFDFTGVSPLAGKMTRLPGGGGAVGRVRVALYSTSPNVTRVVLDLTRPQPFSVDTGDQFSGRIRIVVGTPSVTPPAPAAPTPAPSTAMPPAVKPAAVPPPAPPPPPIPVPQPPGVPAPSTVPSPAPPRPARRGMPQPDLSGARPAPGAVERYRRQLSGSVERLESRRAVIAAIDLEENLAVATLEATLAELKSLRGNLEAVKPSDELRSTHDLLTAACILGASAATLRLEADRGNNLAGRRNAASAAAGALMLLDRACAVLGCAPRR